MNYQIEYQYNGQPSFFEFFLFVNPLGQKCFKCESEISESIKYISTPIEVNVLTYVNNDIVDNVMKQMDVPRSNLNVRNAVFQNIYQATLAYQAASMQGQASGRKLLRAMQSTINGKYLDFSEDFLLDLADGVGLDMDAFRFDLKSDLAKKMFWRDVRTAQEMNVTKTPSLVIYENIFTDAAYLMSEHITLDKIISFLDEILEQICLENTSYNNNYSNKKVMLHELKYNDQRDLNMQ